MGAFKLHLNIAVLICISILCVDQTSSITRMIKYASCDMAQNPNAFSENVNGLVSFKQTFGRRLKIFLSLLVDGVAFVPNIPKRKFKHGFHVHEFLVVDNLCDNAGPHFNPSGEIHGGRNVLISHDGDLGNLRHVLGFKHRFTLNKATLFGNSSIIGRSLVIHGNEDDNGLGGDAQSLIDGNSGRGIACCNIEEDFPVDNDVVQ